MTFINAAQPFTVMLAHRGDMKVATTLPIARIICVALLAMAIAILPLSMGFAAAAPAQASVAASAVEGMPDCMHHQHDGAASGQTQKSIDHGACLTGCALCFGYVDASAADVAYVMAAGGALIVTPADAAHSSLMGSPPFRPPRA